MAMVDRFVKGRMKLGSRLGAISRSSCIFTISHTPRFRPSFAPRNVALPASCLFRTFISSGFVPPHSTTCTSLRRFEHIPASLWTFHRCSLHPHHRRIKIESSRQTLRLKGVFAEHEASLAQIFVMPALIIFFFLCLWISKRSGWIVNLFHAYPLPRNLGDIE
ncbi:hypothetical protein FIBSPDRAFT_399903 [Athelia psychrophila]|uniref:Uncharacterized protein n=1 Tax=Athelia psychrophila TaxID=1759441 RepID=A0A166NFN0_9AGAM|nr:hypothetical protein FIBSPDRAFT_399903 [Fibularhizoctonia sp. CBS 109695]